MPPARAFPFRAFVEKVSALVRRRPEISARIYATAAETLRSHAGAPENQSVALHMHGMAAQFDELAAQATVAPMNFASGEIVGPPYVVNSEVRAETELEEIIRTLQEAKESSGDDLVQLGTYAALRQQQDKKEATPVQITPVSAKVDETLFGTTALCQYGGKVGNAANNTVNAPVTGSQGYQETQVVRWDGRALETMAVTVTVLQPFQGTGASFPSAQNGVGQTYNYRPYVHVFFGSIRGTPSEIFLDVGRGCQFTLATSFLTVAVGMRQPPAGQVPGSATLGATMGFFTCARQAPVVNTQYVDNVAGGGGTKTLIIPDYAMSVVAVIGQNLANWTLTLQTAGGGTLGTITASQVVSNEVVLPGDAYSILCTNNGVGSDSIEVVYRLTF